MFRRRREGPGKGGTPESKGWEDWRRIIILFS